MFGMTLSRFGKHLEQRMVQLADGPQHPPSNPAVGSLHNEEARWWTFTDSPLGQGWRHVDPTTSQMAAYRVTQEAERVESYDRVSAQLSKALLRRLGSAGVVRVEAWYVAHQNAYRVEYQPLGGAIYRHMIPEEELAKNTRTVPEFNGYIDRLRTLLLKQAGIVEGDGPVPKLAGRGSTYEATGRARGPLSSGVIYDEAPGFWHSRTREEEEEREAIESIRRSLNGRPE